MLDKLHFGAKSSFPKTKRRYHGKQGRRLRGSGSGLGESGAAQGSGASRNGARASHHFGVQAQEGAVRRGVGAAAGPDRHAPRDRDGAG